MNFLAGFVGKMDLQRVKLVLLEPVLLLYMMSIWMQFNLFTPLLFRKICMRTYENDSICGNSTRGSHSELKDVQEEASRLLFWSNLCLTIPSIVLAPFLGHWGDRFGRKFPVILPAIGAFLSAVNYAICSGTTAAPELLLLSNLVQGLTGGFTGVILAVSSWASSLSSIRVRTSRLGLLEFANLVGTAIAPAIGGAIAHYASYPWAFGVAGSLNILQILYVVFFLRVEESSQNEQKSLNFCRNLWKLESLRNIWLFVKLTGRDSTGRFRIAMAALCLTVTWLVSTGTGEIRYLFIKTLGLNWDVLENNLYAAEDAGIRGLTLVTVLPFLKHYVRLGDYTIMLAGLLTKVAMFIVWAACKNSAMIFTAPVVGFLAAAVSACGRSAASKCVQKTDQGKLFALLAILENLSSLIGSLIFQNVYVVSISWFPGFPFVLADLFLIVPVVFLLCYLPSLRSSEQTDTMEQNLLPPTSDSEVQPVGSSELSQEDLRFT